MSDEAPKSSLGEQFTPETIVDLMVAMRQNDVAFVELPGLLRLGLMPKASERTMAPVIADPGPGPTAEQAVERMAAARAAARRGGAQNEIDRRARLAERRAGGIGATPGRTIEDLADGVVREMGHPPDPGPQ